MLGTYLFNKLFDKIQKFLDPECMYYQLAETKNEKIIGTIGKIFWYTFCITFDIVFLIALVQGLFLLLPLFEIFIPEFIYIISYIGLAIVYVFKYNTKISARILVDPFYVAFPRGIYIAFVVALFMTYKDYLLGNIYVININGIKPKND